MENILEVKNLKKSFGSNEVLKDVSFSLKQGDSLAVIGASGSGKSVLIKLILGLMSFAEGEINLLGYNVKNISNKARNELMQKLGVLFQGGALFDSLPIWHNVSFSLLHNHKISKEEAKEKAIAQLKEVGLNAEVAELYPSELSGGMQKRVALARAVITKPNLITFDEPTTGLDPIMSDVINELIVNSSKKLNATTITISHDINSVKKVASHVAMLHEGKFIWFGKAEELEKTDNEYIQQFINGNAYGPINLGL